MDNYADKDNAFYWVVKTMDSLKPEVVKITLEEWDEAVNGFVLPKKWCHVLEKEEKQSWVKCMRELHINISPIHSFLDHDTKITSDGIDCSSVPGSRASKKTANRVDSLPSLVDEFRSYTWDPKERYFGGLDFGNGSDSLAVGTFKFPLTPDECFKKVYTIEDLLEGKVALVNDGTKEELAFVLKAAFPDDKFEPSGGAKYYLRSCYLLPSWTCSGMTDKPTQSVKEFYKQLKTENMDNRFPFKLTEKDAKRIVDIACSGWKPRLSAQWGAKLLEKGYVTIEEPFYKEMRKACTDSQNKLFDEIFGRDEEQFKAGDWVVRTLNRGGHHKLGRVFKIARTKSDSIYEDDGVQHFTSSVRKATPEEIAKAQCPYKDGELCWVKVVKPSFNEWELKYATGKVNLEGEPLFYAAQNKMSHYFTSEKHKSAKGVELPKD